MYDHPSKAIELQRRGRVNHCQSGILVFVGMRERAFYKVR